MLTYERYQALRAINIHVPGEPGKDLGSVKFGTRRSGSETRESGTRIASWRSAAIQAARMYACAR